MKTKFLRKIKKINKKQQSLIKGGSSNIIIGDIIDE